MYVFPRGDILLGRYQETFKYELDLYVGVDNRYTDSEIVKEKLCFQSFLFIFCFHYHAHIRWEIRVNIFEEYLLSWFDRISY